MAIAVEAEFPEGIDTLFVERKLMTHGNENDIYGSADSLISRSNPIVHVANFSKKPVIITEGQVLGISKNPKTWLDKMEKFSPEQQTRINAHASFMKIMIDENFAADELQASENNYNVPQKSNSNDFHECEDGICVFCKKVSGKTDKTDNYSPDSTTSAIHSESKISSKAQRNATEADDPLAGEPVEGGPKTSEPPPEPVSGDRLLAEVDFSPDLLESQRKQLEEVVLKNSKAFGLDGRLGDYAAHIDITMKPNAEPVSLPPFHASPANREVIDKQMDSWIKLGVIEPSKSPWAAPVFIVYRNGKPRMVIDLRKMNDMAISDEFPLPRQDDILQALNGSQWLTTLDALAGFTQLTMTDYGSSDACHLDTRMVPVFFSALCKMF
jgi:hypothetical protein